MVACICTKMMIIDQAMQGTDDVGGGAAGVWRRRGDGGLELTWNGAKFAVGRDLAGVKS